MLYSKQLFTVPLLPSEIDARFLLVSEVVEESLLYPLSSIRVFNKITLATGFSKQQIDPTDVSFGNIGYPTKIQSPSGVNGHRERRLIFISL